MPISLQVRQIRDEILRAAGGPQRSGHGHAQGNRLAGTLFHEIFSGLFGGDPALQARSALLHTPPDPEALRSALREHAYRFLLGPRLQANHAVLQTETAEVMVLWKAVEALTTWICGLFQQASSVELPSLVAIDQPLVWTLREPGWTDSVTINGVADAIIRMPGEQAWCVIEFKTGESAPEADLAQACLYHQMLAASRQSEGSLALVYFTPKIRQKLFSPQELAPVSDRLKTLIGRLAGVLPGDPQAAPLPPRTPLRPHPGLTPDHIEFGRKLLAVFREYNAPVELSGDPVSGPTFLRFPVQPARGIRPEAVKKLKTAVQVRLGLKATPFIEGTAGRMVIDVERPDRETVLFHTIHTQLPTPDPISGCSRLPIGIDLDYQLRFADLSDSANCHILVAGTTGSGKTEWLRTALASLILTNDPKTLQLVLIDPKRSAFNELRDSPFVWGDRQIIYPDETDPIEVLDMLVEEMERRYRIFQSAAVDNLQQYHLKGQPLPRIVCVCEEYADMLLRGRKDVEERIQRLGQKARGAGIHLILAVQQPSRDIVKGTLQSNIPARVGLRVNSPIESRMLLDRAGAEDLLGNGDLLFKDIGEPVRLQAPLLPADERRVIFGGNA